MMQSTESRKRSNHASCCRQVGFSTAIRKISARTSSLARFLPPTRRARESQFQYSREPARCQATTVLGVTRTSESPQPDQSLRRAIQNSLWMVDSRRRGRLACNASSCWRSAKFSRIRSWRERKMQTIQPIKCRREEIMDQNLVAHASATLFRSRSLYECWTF